MRSPMMRVVVTPGLMVFGVLAMIGGELGGGMIFCIAGAAYWRLAGWLARPRNRRAERREGPAKPRPAAVVSVAEHGVRSDGTSGAFSRLDPVWRNWLSEEFEARRTDETPPQSSTR